MDFISKTMEPFYYNRGLYDAQALLQEQLYYVEKLIHQLKKNTTKTY